MFTVNTYDLNPSRRSARLYLYTVLALYAILLGACGDRSAAPQSAAPAIHITVIPDPAGAEGDTLTVQLSGGNGQPLTGAQVSITGNMTHPGMAPVVSDAVADDADGTVDGWYAIPFQFSMLGDWILAVAATLADGSIANQDIPVVVTEGGVTVAGADRAGLQVTDARARPSPTAAANSALFLTIVNAATTPDHLVSVTSPVAAAETHETMNDNGIMRMVTRPEGFEIPANGALELAPGGKHIMLRNLTQPLQPGQSIEVTLTFAHAPPLTLNVPVVEMSETMPEGEAMPDHSSP